MDLRRRDVEVFEAVIADDGDVDLGGLGSSGMTATSEPANAPKPPPRLPI